MNPNAIKYLKSLLTKVTDKDYKVTEKDIEEIQVKHKENEVVFPKSLTDFYIKYNEVLKHNIRFENIYSSTDEDGENYFFPGIELNPLKSKFKGVSVEWSLDIVLYYKDDRYYLNGLVPIGVDDGGALVCYKIDDGRIILYLDDLEDENDYDIVVNSFDELFEYLVERENIN